MLEILKTCSTASGKGSPKTVGRNETSINSCLWRSTMFGLVWLLQSITRPGRLSPLSAWWGGGTTPSCCRRFVRIRVPIRTLFVRRLLEFRFRNQLDSQIYVFGLKTEIEEKSPCSPPNLVVWSLVLFEGVLVLLLD